MTLSLPRYRNSFHLAWFLLLLPPLASFVLQYLDETSLQQLIRGGFAAAEFNETPLQRIALVLRLVLAVLVIAPVLWFRTDTVTGRVQRLLKELRVLMPGCLIAVFVPGIFAWAQDAGSMIFAFGLGCLWMVAATFGSEFEQRTIGNLLAQPLARSTVYLEKMSVVSALCLVATSNLWLSIVPYGGLRIREEDLLELTPIVLFALGSTPLFSLLSRSTLAGMIFTVTIAPIYYLLAALGLEMVNRWQNPGLPIPSEWHSWLLGVGAPIYLLTTTVLGWRQFKNLELRDGGAGGRSSSGLHPLSLPVDRLLGRLLPQGNGTTRLIRKELRLHVIPWLVGGITVGLWLLWLAVRQFATDESLVAVLNDSQSLAIFGGLLGSLALVGAGAACVAEERELGTLETAVTQPIPLARQWWTKVAVTGVLAFVFGALLPGILLWVSFDETRLQMVFGNQPQGTFVAAGAVCLASLAVCIYASSFCRNTMKATATAVGLGLTFATCIAFTAWAAGERLDAAITAQREIWETSGVTAPEWAPSPEALFYLAGAALAGGTLLFLALLLSRAGRNYRSSVIPLRTIVQQVMGMIALIPLLICLGGVLLSRLTLLQMQAQYADTQQDLRVQAIARATQRAEGGVMPPEITADFNVPANLTPEAFVEAVIDREGMQSLNSLTLRLQPPPPKEAATLRLDPALAQRYGIQGTAGNTAPAKATNQPTPGFRMDPALMKRYGLQPQPAKQPPSVPTPQQ